MKAVASQLIEAQVPTVNTAGAWVISWEPLDICSLYTLTFPILAGGVFSTRENKKQLVGKGSWQYSGRSGIGLEALGGPIAEAEPQTDEPWLYSPAAM